MASRCSPSIPIPVSCTEMSKSLASAPAADQYPTLERVADRIADQIAQYGLKQVHIGPDPGARGHEIKRQPRRARDAGEFRNDPVEHRAHRKIGVLRLDAARIEAGDVQQRVEQIAERGERDARLVQVIQIEPRQRSLADRLQKQQRRAQGLPQIVAGRREKAGLGLIRAVGELLGLLERELDFTPRLRVPASGAH